MMTSVLFVTWDGGGNVPPMLAVASEMQRRGHAVRVLGHPSQRAAVVSAGLAFEAYATARSWSALKRRSSLRADLAYAAVFADRRLGRDVVRSARRSPVDRIVVDGLLIGALSELCRAGFRYTIFVHTLRAAMYRAVVRGPLGAVLHVRGLRPAHLYEIADLELVVTDPLLDVRPRANAASIVHTGPVFAERATPSTFDDPPAEVLVSLSTTYVHGQADLLQRIVEAIAPLPVRVIVTTGPAISPDELRPSANTDVHAYLPHADAMASASVVVGHGGHATTLLALAHGIPLLIIPTNTSFDQPVIGHVIAAHGLGLTLDKRASTEAIRDAVAELIRRQSYRDRAGEVGRRIRGAPNGAVVAADRLAGRAATEG